MLFYNLNPKGTQLRPFGLGIFKNHTTENLIDSIQFWDWEDFWRCEDVNDSWIIVQDCIIDYFDNCKLQSK